MNLKLIVYDFDGVMTDNRVYIDQQGNEMVRVSRADGLGVAEIKKLGIEQIIISTEKNMIVSTRANKLKIQCFQGIDDKKLTLDKFCITNKIDKKYIAYVGNDINDKEVMQISGITFCPADAHNSIKAISNFVLKTKGGKGVVRELFDLLIEKKES